MAMADENDDVDDEEDLAEEWGDIIYFCVECDEAERSEGDYRNCSNFPQYHDGSGIMGTGPSYPEDIREMARKIYQLESEER